MAPTELLAEQHERTLRRLARAGGDATSLRIALLTASVPRARGEGAPRRARGGRDRPGRRHARAGPGRRALRALGARGDRRAAPLRRAAAPGARGQAARRRSPHVLVMTATPIPRTLALTLAGDLDVSVIDELPPGRTPVATDVLREGEGARVVEAMRATLARGEQVYVVYPLVEESEKIDLRAATEMSQRIARAFPDARVDLVHGRLDAAARAEAMARFERGETQILVSTTVIEVGVDVPNATLMVVEHAERFGLAQLHQLRGRVGRGERPGTCLLVARGATADSEARLRALLETADGFAIAEADLRIRGPGEFLGTRQHGRLPDLRFADLVRDARLLPVASEAALETVRQDPGLARDAALLRAVRDALGREARARERRLTNATKEASMDRPARSLGAGDRRVERARRRLRARLRRARLQARAGRAPRGAARAARRRARGGARHRDARRRARPRARGAPDELHDLLRAEGIDVARARQQRRRAASSVRSSRASGRGSARCSRSTSSRSRTSRTASRRTWPRAAAATCCRSRRSARSCRRRPTRPTRPRRATCSRSAKRSRASCSRTACASARSARASPRRSSSKPRGSRGRCSSACR